LQGLGRRGQLRAGEELGDGRLHADAARPSRSAGAQRDHGDRARVGEQPVRARLARRRARGHGAHQGGRARRDVDRVEPRLRRQGQGVGAPRRRRGRHRRRLGRRAIVDIVDPRLADYADRLTSPHEPLLVELSEETREELGSEGMLTGPVAGRLLELLVWFGRPHRVLEIGTFSGHSALAMAAALPEGGRVDTGEVDPERAAFAQRYFDRSPYGSRITSHVGPALETISRLQGDFDFVFVDADKGGYVDYYEAVVPRLSERGLIVADNTLWNGQVL